MTNLNHRAIVANLLLRIRQSYRWAKHGSLEPATLHPIGETDTSTLSRHQKPWTPNLCSKLHGRTVCVPNGILKAWYFRLLLSVLELQSSLVGFCNILWRSILDIYLSSGRSKLCQKKKRSTSISEAGDHSEWRPQQWAMCHRWGPTDPYFLYHYYHLKYVVMSRA